MSQPWYHDPRMLAAGNARRRPFGESDLLQPGSAQAMPAPPGRPIKPVGTEVERSIAERDARQEFTAAFLAEAKAFALDPADLARLYAKAYARPQTGRHSRPGILSRLFARKARP